MGKIIKVKVKQPGKEQPTFKDFLNVLNNYAKDKYGVKVQQLNKDVYIQDIICAALYKDDIFKLWYEEYKKGNNIYRDEFDVLLYYQTIQMFVNMFGKEQDTLN